MKKTHLTALAALVCAASLTTQAQPLVNLGLVGVGRVPADTLDSLGMDSLGGMFSALWLDPATVARSGDTYSATLYPQPDRGFGDGAAAYHPRILRASFSITPYYGSGPVAQDQIVFVNNGALIYTENGNRFTGYIPDDTNFVAYPKSLATGLGLGLWSLDPEGVTRAPDGTWYVSDEYGPFIYHFDTLGALMNTLAPPDAYLPKMGPAYPRVINYNAASTVATNDSGRYNNRGLEGVTITPSGKKLVTILQSPLVQDGENRNPSRNTRILVYDIDPTSATYNTPIAEYVHVLPPNAAEANNRHTPVSEILALSESKFLILQRDGRGLGGDAGAFLYKRIVEVDVSAASNLIGTGYDLEKGAPGQIALPRSSLPAGIVAVTSRDLVDLINPAQLAKYGLNLNVTNQDANTVCEKWEGMAVLPLNDPAAPNDYLLLVGNDNDFKTALVYHNGIVVGTNTIIVDNMLLAFRIGADAIAPTITCPVDTIRVAAAASCALPNVTSLATASDNSAAPVSITQTPAAGSAVALETPITVTVAARDAAGNLSEPCNFTVVVFDGPPSLKVPAALTLSADAACSAIVPNLLTNAATVATDNCSAVTLEQNPPAGTVIGLGVTTVTISATDAVNNTVSGTVKITVADKTAPTVACPAALTLAADTNCQALIPDLLAGVTVSDNCSGAVTLSQNPPAGTVAGLGEHSVTVTGVDAAGNTNTCSVVVTVADQTAPKINFLAASPSILRPAWWQMVPVKIKVDAADNCDPAPKCRIVSVTSNFGDGKGKDSDGGKANWIITGDLSLQLRAIPSTRRFTRIYRITVECVDAAGNRTTRTTSVVVARDSKGR
jgi:hypothetical protein